MNRTASKPRKGDLASNLRHGPPELKTGGLPPPPATCGPLGVFGKGHSTTHSAGSVTTAPAPRGLSLILAATLAGGLTWSSLAEPFRPSSPDTVLIRLPRFFNLTAPSPGFSPGSLSSTTVPQPPADVAQAVATTRQLVLAARRTADPRLLSRARLQLHPWWTATQAPTEVILLRAEIRQGLHDFPAALADIELALRNDPRHPGAWLLKATLHQVRGDYDAARGACLQLARFADELIAVTATVALRGLTDPSSASAVLLEKTLRTHPEADPAIRAWAFTTLGEVRSRHGDPTAAEAAFRSALELEPAHPYTLAVLADLLIDHGRATEVRVLLRDATAESLLLRLAEARFRTAPNAPETQMAIEELSDSFAIAARRGDELHLREHSRFALRLGNDAAGALRLARRNWEIQKEPADLEILLEAARRTGDTQTLSDARSWAQRHQPAVLAQGKLRTAIHETPTR